jgi:hypothetical protein
MRDLLEAHGTKLLVLPPSAIIAAAEADLKLRRGRDASDAGKPYCFHRRHVAAAACALDLIDRAIADRYSGVYCGKRITRTIYGDEVLLREVRALLSPLTSAQSREAA